QALKDIGNALGKKNWDFSVDPCSGERNWTSHTKVRGSENNVTCDCSFANATICHSFESPKSPRHSSTRTCQVALPSRNVCYS
ncbi:putative LRR receptor-like serine/threonine-protein kinase, partial [Mucuna pruriens]